MGKVLFLRPEISLWPVAQAARTTCQRGASRPASRSPRCPGRSCRWIDLSVPLRGKRKPNSGALDRRDRSVREGVAMAFPQGPFVPQEGPRRIIPCIVCGMGLIHTGAPPTYDVTCWFHHRPGTMTPYGSILYSFHDFMRHQGHEDALYMLHLYGLRAWLDVAWRSRSRYEYLGLMLECEGFGPGYLVSIRLARRALGLEPFPFPDPLEEEVPSSPAYVPTHRFLPS